MTKERFHGFYSADYVSNGFPTVIWSRPDGSRVEVCFVENAAEHSSGWKDVTYVGEVVDYVKRGQPGSHSTYFMREKL